jgi:hypothetical protein
MLGLVCVMMLAAVDVTALGTVNNLLGRDQGIIQKIFKTCAGDHDYLGALNHAHLRNL